MNTLYAAKKYDIHPFVTECVRYCTARLTATNAVSLLAQARLLDENTLVEQVFIKANIKKKIIQKFVSVIK